MVRAYYSLLAVFIVLIATSAKAYPTPVDFDGKLLRWNISADSEPIYYEIIAETEGDDVFFGPAITTAVEMWNAVDGSYFRYTLAPAGQYADVTINLQANTGDQYSSGYAIFDQSDANGPVHCEILIGTSNTYEGFSKTVLHELGHCLGLGHSLIPQAIMSYKLEKNTFALDIDDQAAVTRLYPADGTEPALPLGCSIGIKHRGVTPFLLLIPLFIVGIRPRSRVSLRINNLLRSYPRRRG